jgi:hypothetical protein
MRKRIKKILASSTVAACVAAMLIPRSGRTAFLDGCAWGCFLILFDSLLFCYFATRKIAPNPMAVIWVYLISAAVRLPVIAGTFLLLVMSARVDGLGLITGVTVAFMSLIAIAMLVVFRGAQLQEAVS